MTLDLLLAIIAAIVALLGLLFLSMIHLFMIPKDVMKRDTTRQPHLEGDTDMDTKLAGRDIEKPEIKENPNAPSDPEIEEKPRPEPEVEREPRQHDEPEPEVEREPGQHDEPEPEKEPDPRK